MGHCRFAVLCDLMMMVPQQAQMTGLPEPLSMAEEHLSSYRERGCWCQGDCSVFVSPADHGSGDVGSCCLYQKSS